mgnify:CR=1 FL=1|tara:strand:+ start:10441 stop:11748 length:1308 start_codon:yes stop_codon:yes gene_type:complete
MVASRIQIVAIGHQDKHLTGNPQISFFKAVYKRHTNFFSHKKKIKFDIAPDFGTKGTVKLSHYGDLLYDMAVVFDLPQLTTGGSTTTNISYTNAIGHTIIKNISFKLGGRTIDSYSGEWLHIWKELTTNKSDKEIYDYLIGQSIISRHKERIDDTSYTTTDFVRLNNTKYTLYENYNGNLSTDNYGHLIVTPLKFWFCQQRHKAIPICALKHHNIDIDLELRPFSECYTTSGTADSKNVTDVYLLADYIFLDDDEKRKFINKEHKYLISQIQMNEFSISASTTSQNMLLNFHNPIKELVWVVQLDSMSTDNEWTNFSNNTLISEFQRETYKPITKAKIQFDGKDRTENLEEIFYRKYEVLRKHSGNPESFIYVYPFALEPENFKQPTGTCNFSRLHSAHLNLTFNSIGASKVRVYAISYNILIIKDGMGGILYQN